MKRNTNGRTGLALDFTNFNRIGKLVLIRQCALEGSFKTCHLMQVTFVLVRAITC